MTERCRNAKFGVMCQLVVNHRGEHIAMVTPPRWALYKSWDATSRKATETVDPGRRQWADGYPLVEGGYIRDTP